ncbi:MAG: hypothetical protein PCFJNLEI_02401 [Verrucomicrobiae bacterium]|nr:hypothetical protein [Verrucomicrobiae bacterium]
MPFACQSFSILAEFARCQTECLSVVTSTEKLLRIAMENEKNIPSTTSAAIEAEATLALSELNRRARLLAVVRGKSLWRLYVAAAIWLILLVYLFNTEIPNSKVALVSLVSLAFLIIGSYVDSSRRMNALIELIGEENLKGGKVIGRGGQRLTIDKTSK